MAPPFNETVFNDLEDSAAQGATDSSSSDRDDNVAANPEAIQAIPEAHPRGTFLFHPLLPASYRTVNGKDKPEIVVATDAMVENDLRVTRLNDIHHWLWFAGRPMPPRPLNYQVANSREIILSEDMGLHLVWAIPRRIFLKPIPGYLLDHQFWKVKLIHRESLYQCALGFLLSYTALIQYESDFYIAKDKRLIPRNLTWETWIKLVEQLLHHKNENVNRRYDYGELRLSRLNKIYWAHCRLRGYRFPYQSYGEMFKANLAPIAGTIVYIGLVLTAMQVGLATHRLGNNDAFQNVSYGFTVFSILAPIILVFLVIFLLVVYFLYNCIATVLFRRAVLRNKYQSQA